MMRVVGLDLGSKTLGIAMSDALGMMAHGVETFPFTTAHYKHAILHLVEFVEKESVAKFILGIPKNMDGSEGERAAISRRFAEKLKVATGLPVILWDERLTSMQAQRVLIDGNVRRENRKAHIDKLAAVIILQSYLDANG